MSTLMDWKENLVPRKFQLQPSCTPPHIYEHHSLALMKISVCQYSKYRSCPLTKSWLNCKLC